MNSFTYRQLTADDAATWQDLRVAGVKNFPLGFMTSLKEALSTPLERCRNILQGGAFRGVFEQTQLIGFCGYHTHQMSRIKHRAELGPFFVSPTYQGTGAAQILMKGVAQEARRNGIAKLELYVDTQNPRAIAFYEAQGFHRIATHYDTIRIDGQSYNDYFYVLNL